MATQIKYRFNHAGYDAFDRRHRHTGSLEPEAIPLGSPVTRRNASWRSEAFPPVIENGLAAWEIASALGAAGQVTKWRHGIDPCRSLCHESATSAAPGVSQPLSTVAAGLDVVGHVVGFAADVHKRRKDELARHGDEARATAAAIAGTFVKTAVAAVVGAAGAILCPPAAPFIALGAGLIASRLTQPLAEDEPQTPPDIPGAPYLQPWQAAKLSLPIEALGTRSVFPLVDGDSFARSHLVEIQPSHFETCRPLVFNSGSSKWTGRMGYVKPGAHQRMPFPSV